MIPPYTRVKVIGKNTAGSDDWKNMDGVVYPDYSTTVRVHFFGPDENGKIIPRGISTFHVKSLKIEKPKSGDVVMVPAIFKEQKGNTPECVVTMIDKKTHVTMPLAMVVPVEPKG